MTDMEIERLEDAARRVFGGAGVESEIETAERNGWLGRAWKDLCPVRSQMREPARYEHRAG